MEEICSVLFAPPLQKVSLHPPVLYPALLATPSVVTWSPTGAQSASASAPERSKRMRGAGRWSEECWSLQAEAGLGQELAGKQTVLVFPDRLWGTAQPSVWRRWGRFKLNLA